MSTNLQSIKGSWDTEIKRVRSNAKLVAAEVDEMNDDLKLINECWKSDRKQIEQLRAERDKLKEENERLKKVIEIYYSADINSPIETSILTIPQMQKIASLFEI